MAYLIFIGMILIVFGFVYLIIDFAEGRIVSRTYENINERNQLKQCRECDRLYRFYQRDLVRAARGRMECPHCGKSLWQSREINTPDKWMDSHTDCPKISIPSYIKILKAIKTVKKLRKEREEIERFEKYNNLKADVDWIIKLQKDLSK